MEVRFLNSTMKILPRIKGPIFINSILKEFLILKVNTFNDILLEIFGPPLKYIIPLLGRYIEAD